MMMDFYQANNLIGEKLKSGEPFSCLRIDNTAGYVLHCLYQTNTMPSEEFCNDEIMMHSGIIPAKRDYYLSTIMPKTFSVMKECDILGFVDIGNLIRNDNNFLSNFGNIPIFCNHFVMDPSALLGYKTGYQPMIPWTQYLEGKKVLVVSTHSNSIKYQWNNMDSVWGENRNKIVPFELVDAIRTPYHPLLDSRQYDNCNDYMDLIEITKRIIDQYEYDVLLTGVTTQSAFYAEHAKKMGKVGIQTGGALQLFFGIIGNRWLQPWYSDGARMFNDKWIWPMQIDEPEKKNLVTSETGFAYWR